MSPCHSGQCRDLVWALVSLVLAVPVASGQDEGNLVTNPGFEDVTAQGSPAGSSLPQPVYSVVTDVVRSGARALRYTNDEATRYQLTATALPCEPGARYEFEAWVRTENLQGDDTGATVCIAVSYTHLTLPTNREV